MDTNKDLSTFSISGILQALIQMTIFAVIMLTGLLLNKWAFAGLLIAMVILCIREFFRLTEKVDEVVYFSGDYRALVILSCLLCLYLAGVQSAEVDRVTRPETGLIAGVVTAGIQFVEVLLWIILFLILGIPVIVFFVLYLVRLGKGGPVSGRLLHALVYVTLPALALLLLRGMHWTYPAVLICCTWINTASAYLVDRWFGKWPISRSAGRKSWEGVIFGAVVTIAAAVAATFINPDFTLEALLPLSLCAVVAGTAGNVYLARMKQKGGVGQTGTLLPGIGGTLDLFGPVLFAAPCALLTLGFVNIT